LMGKTQARQRRDLTVKQAEGVMAEIQRLEIFSDYI
jgi:hypothetical protein